jgi:dihydrolipoamide dehydrogenase
VAVIEKRKLRWCLLKLGLYPNKSIIEISSGFNYLKHASDYGLTVSSFDKDFAVVQRSRTIASDMSKGVQFLMKKIKSM